MAHETFCLHLDLSQSEDGSLSYAVEYRSHSRLEARDGNAVVVQDPSGIELFGDAFLSTLTQSNGAPLLPTIRLRRPARSEGGPQQLALMDAWGDDGADCPPTENARAD